MQGCEGASVAIFPHAGDLNDTRVQKLHEPVSSPQGKGSLILTCSVQFRRVDVGDADLLAFKPHGIAIVDTMVTRAKSTDS